MQYIFFAKMLGEIFIIFGREGAGRRYHLRGKFIKKNLFLNPFPYFSPENRCLCKQKASQCT